jgi:fatty acid amide hydrolase
MRIGIYTDNGYFPVSPGVRRVVEDAADALRSIGATVEGVLPPDPEEGVRIFLRGASAGAGSDYFRLLGDEKPIPQVAGLLRGVQMPAPVRAVVARIMEARDQHHLARLIRTMRPCSAAEYFEVVESRNAYRAAHLRTLDEGGFDALICPPVALPAFTHGSSEHLFAAVTYALVYNVLGAPAGVVSIGRVRAGEESDRRVTKDLADIHAQQVERGSAGLPLGVQVVGRHWRDDVVLAVMSALEQCFAGTPDFPNAANLIP